MSVDEKFKVACDEVRKFAKKPSDPDLLDIYSLYKQATVGNINIPKPAEATAKAKWDAWNSRKGLTPQTAKEQYITIVKTLSAKYA